mmetsp:Transcript_190/g.708  ORF Transcript_190/g.708 Transcript_190/m.708 type:complete len:221 (+) Transcript_190:632-1294(+)
MMRFATPSTEQSCRRGTRSYNPRSTASALTSTPPTAYGSSSSAMTTLTLNVVNKSFVIIAGAPMTTSSAYLHAKTLNARSFSFKTGCSAPRLARTSASACTPTSTKSPRVFAWRNKSICPRLNTSNAPCTYTTLASVGTPAFVPNCAMRADVVQNVASFASSSFTASPAARAPIRSNLPTISVVLTPSVRFISLYLPIRFGYAYASEPSGNRHGSSPCIT